MTKSTFLFVVALSVIIFVIGMMLPTEIDDKRSIGFPWQIEKMEDGSISVFNINLGKTTMGEVEKLFKEEAKLTLFKPENGNAVIEAYFNDLFIGGLKSKMVLAFEIDQAEILQMYERGVRISTLGSGTRRVTLSSDDEKLMRTKTINNITYIPAVNLDAELIEKRFGAPTERITEEENGAEHWLYHEMGVDVALNQEGKEVIQYINPHEFEKIIAPLKKP